VTASHAFHNSRHSARDGTGCAAYTSGCIGKKIAGFDTRCSPADTFSDVKGKLCRQARLTIIASAVGPNRVFSKASTFPEFKNLLAAVFVALFDSDPFTFRYPDAFNVYVLEWCNECMMASSLLVELSNDLPLVRLESFISHKSVGVLQSVQNELVSYVFTVVVGVIYTIRIFARVNADKHGIARLDSIAEPGKERRCFMSLEVTQTGTEPKNGLWLILDAG
jgi:hypothetical protein